MYPNTEPSFSTRTRPIFFSEKTFDCSVAFTNRCSVAGRVESPEDRHISSSSTTTFRWCNLYSTTPTMQRNTTVRKQLQHLRRKEKAKKRNRPTPTLKRTHRERRIMQFCFGDRNRPVVPYTGLSTTQITVVNKHLTITPSSLSQRNGK